VQPPLLLYVFVFADTEHAGMHFCLPACLSVFLFFCLSVCLSICRCLCVFLLVGRSACLSASQCVIFLVLGMQPLLPFPQCVCARACVWVHMFV
jgi:hypothetical protein